jgi:predicted NUDIX family NTP pyrophosphohydrolase
MQQSAGTLLYRKRDGQLEVLLVHPSGNYNRRAPWSIPKGLPDEGEALEAAARRETWEETGVTAGELVPLGTIRYQKSRKEIHCFSGPAAVPRHTAHRGKWTGQVRSGTGPGSCTRPNAVSGTVGAMDGR